MEGLDLVNTAIFVGAALVLIGIFSSLVATRFGAPLLLAPAPEDIFEHNGEWGKIKSVPKQDHAYDVVISGDLAFVADGGNGLTIYDLTKDPTVIDSGFFVSNLSGANKARPLLGRSTGIALWTSRMGRDYALLAAGPYGVGVADVTHLDLIDDQVGEAELGADQDVVGAERDDEARQLGLFDEPTVGETDAQCHCERNRDRDPEVEAGSAELPGRLGEHHDENAHRARHRT